MKNNLLLLITLVIFSGNMVAQNTNTFSLKIGSISTQNSTAQPATSLTGYFEAILTDLNEKAKVTLSIDHSRFLAEGLRLSSCNDCSDKDYSGWDLGMKFRLELQSAEVTSVNFFTGPSIVMTKEKYSYESGYTIAYNIEVNEGERRLRNYFNRFWDLGIGLKVDISDKTFFSAETVVGYSLDPSPGEPQGIGRYELNLGIGIKF